MFPVTIRRRFITYHAIGMALLIGISAFATVQLYRLDGITETLDRRWLAGDRALGETARLLTAIRLDETNFIAAPTPQDQERHRASVVQHAREIQAQLDAYNSLLMPDEDRSLQRNFSFALEKYLRRQRALMARTDTLPAPEISRALEDSEWLFVATEAAVDALIIENGRSAQEQALMADRIADGSALVTGIVAVLAVLSGFWILSAAMRQIVRPLSDITWALSELARGNRHVEVPETERQDEIGELGRALEVFRSNVFSLEEAHRVAEASQARAQTLARHDALTGLPNRRFLSEILDQAVAGAERGTRTAVMMIDLDRFKPVNDALGHSAGDAVLIRIAMRLKEIARTNDMLSRLGGDEFALVARLSSDPDKAMHEAVAIARRIIEVTSEPIMLGESRVDVGASLGIALCPSDGTDAETLLRAADIAMYRAKRDGRSAFRFFEPAMDAELRARGELERDVRRAVAAEEIEPYFQPLIELSTNRLLGFEVLARWNGAGSTTPDVFIPMIEHSGLMSAFTLSMLRRACKAAESWPSNFILAINVSPSLLQDSLFPVQLLAALNASGFSPARLEVEITETALLDNIEMVKETLAALRGLGISIALDDFGTGYSSLNHLRELHLDKIKIDRSFVGSLHTDTESAKIVEAILGLARSLMLPTTGEGIETAEIAEQMSRGGCTYGQGYLYGGAMTAAEANAMIEHRSGGKLKSA